MSLLTGAAEVGDARFREGRAALLVAADAGAADRAQVLATAALIQDGDADAWLREWTALGGEAWAAACRHPSARHFLHAASYYAAPLPLIADTDGLVSEAALWRRQRTCWHRAVELLGGERIAIPYERTTLPGYFVPGGPGRRPLIVTDHGGREPTSQSWARVGARAHARGLHWMTFDGPGRQGALIEQGLVVRPDWEAVLRPVTDAVVARADVDPKRMAVIGLEHAGYGIARGLAFEHRFATAALDPGVHDLSRPWTDTLSSAAHEALLTGNRPAFVEELRLARLFDPDHENRLRRRGRCYGQTDLFDLYTRILAFRLGDEVQRITTPVRVRERDDERDWHGQARTLHARLPGPRHHLAAHDDGLAWVTRELGL